MIWYLIAMDRVSLDVATWNLLKQEKTLPFECYLHKFVQFRFAILGDENSRLTEGKHICSILSPEQWRGKPERDIHPTKS